MALSTLRAPPMPVACTIRRFCAARDAGRRTMFGFGKSSKDPLSDVRAAERWLATLPGADTLAVHSNVIARARARSRARRRSGTPHRLRAVFHVDAQTGAQRRALIGAVHRAREPQLEDREPALDGAVRADAGLPANLPVVRARDRRSLAEPPLAGAAAGARSAGRSFISRSTRGCGSSATSNGFPRSGRSCTALMSLACSQQIERRARHAHGVEHDHASSTNTCARSCCI